MKRNTIAHVTDAHTFKNTHLYYIFKVSRSFKFNFFCCFDLLLTVRAQGPGLARPRKTNDTSRRSSA